ncbi:hypothetical protein SAMN02990966_04468 [Rhodospirillales bacterium URHD0017]|nr:hypothetical protein SAMN02990966_04468 [Rhodospirillales bacterium URHD0017]
MRIFSVTLIAALVGLASHHAQAQDPSAQYRGLQTLDIPFANGPIAMDRVPHVWLKLRGSRPVRFGMDTGSTGIVVAAEHFTPGPSDIAEGPGRLIYNSSGRILNGERYTTEVVIQRDEATPVATARVQVLRVSSITCLERARDCRPESNPRGVAFMGVGFDRTGAESIGTGGTEPGVPRNPFVSLVSLASGAPLSLVRPGYIVTREGVHLGMSAERTRGFAFIKLAANAASRPGVPEWSATPMAVSVDGVTGNGTVLVDTGINYMFLSPPEGARLERGRRAPEGSRITVFLPDQRNPQPAYYGFTVGGRGNPMHPERVEVVHDRGVFVNTGRMFLEGFDYLYDAAGGYVGFGWNGRLGSGYGGVTPGLSYAP